MLKVSVCPAVAEDAEAIAALNESCFGQAYPVAKVKRQLEQLILRPNEQVLVAVYRGRLIGYIHAADCLRTYEAPSKLVYAVAVDKEYRRKGVATTLWTAVENWAKQDKCDELNTAVGGSKAAQAFCVAVGCEEQLNRKDYSKSLKTVSVLDDRKA